MAVATWRRERERQAKGREIGQNFRKCERQIDGLGIRSNPLYSIAQSHVTNMYK